MEPTTEVEAAFQKGAALADARRTDEQGVPYTVLPQGYTVHNLQSLLGAPLRKKGTANFARLEPFLRYVNAHKGDGTEVYANQDNGTLAAVLNGNAGGAPGWNDHLAHLNLGADKAWDAWTGQDRKTFSPLAFAEFLEEWGDFATDPKAGPLFDLVSNLKIEEHVVFTSKQELGNGSVKFGYESTVQGKGGGEMPVPGEIKLCLKRYEGEELPENASGYEVTARLRYRLNSQKLTFQILFNHLERIEEVAFANICRQVEAATNIKPYLGSFSAK